MGTSAVLIALVPYLEQLIHVAHPSSAFTLIASAIFGRIDAGDMELVEQTVTVKLAIPPSIEIVRKSKKKDTARQAIDDGLVP